MIDKLYTLQDTELLIAYYLFFGFLGGTIVSSFGLAIRIFKRITDKL